ncbi:hypothetical protein [Ferruginibacter sp.]|nr:hypothetical protein [Ferruginibacter sp.]
MKNKSIFLFAISAILIFSAFKLADDIIARLALTHKNAQGYILTNIIGAEDPDGGNSNGTLSLPYIKKMLPNIINGDKAGAAKELCQYVKDYINSEEFLAQYAKRKEAALPLEDQGNNIASLRRTVEVHQININNYKNDTKYVAEQEKEKAAAQARLDKLLEAAKKPFPQKTEWEQAYPTNPAVLVKKRLEEYLKTVAAVDFNAKISEADKYGTKKFLSPLYEKKSNKWKAIYRAGKEVNDVVTAFVKEWLKGEIIAAQKVQIPTDDTEKKTNNNNNSNNKQATNTNTNSNTSTNNASSTSGTATDAKPADAVTPVKEKKNLFKKLKDKTKGVINY